MSLDYMRDLKECKQVKNTKVVKKGTLDIGIVETTPVVWKNSLLRFEWIRNDRWGAGYYANLLGRGYYRFTDMKTEALTPPFAVDHAFGCAYCENDTMYVVGVEGPGGGNRLNYFVSTDLVKWDSGTALEFPSDWSVYNTSICRGADGYMMAIEIGSPPKIAGVAFTNVFARSDDLMHWTPLDPIRYVYTKERYSACPVIRFVSGYYYMIYLEGIPGYRWIPYIVRSRDLLSWELGLVNPVMFYSEEDKRVIRPEKFTQEQLDYIASAVDSNNSDLDLCEWDGQTVILYSWGNQQGNEFLAEAMYDGDLQTFLESFFA